MTKFVYCSECGMKLQVFKRALKGYGRIIDIINPHECSSEPIEIDLTPTEIPTKLDSNGKFVQKLNNLRPSKVNQPDLRDRRSEPEVKSSAPTNVIQRMKNQMLCTDLGVKSVDFEDSND